MKARRRDPASMSDVGTFVDPPGRLAFFVPGGLTNPLNASRWTWQVRSRWAKEWRRKTHLLAGSAIHSRERPTPPQTRLNEWVGGAPTYPKRVLLLARVWSLFDEGNLWAALKPVLDGLVDAKLLDDDGPRTRHEIKVEQVVDRCHRGVEIVVEVVG